MVFTGGAVMTTATTDWQAAFEVWLAPFLARLGVRKRLLAQIGERTRQGVTADRTFMDDDLKAKL